MLRLRLSGFILLSITALVAANGVMPVPTASITPSPTLPSRELDARQTLSFTTTAVTVDGWTKISGSCSGTGTVALQPFVTKVPLITTSNSALNAYLTYCPYYVTVVTSLPPYPYTSTAPNSAVIAYQSTVKAPGQTPSWNGTGPSSTVHGGKSLLMEIHPSAFQNVGTLTGSDLFTSVSSALVSGCGTVAEGATMTTCSKLPQITNVAYTEAEPLLFEEAWFHTDGVLSLEIPWMSVSDQNVLTALINAVAGAMSASTLIPNNTTPVNHNCYVPSDPSDHSDKECYTTNMTNAADTVQAIYTDNTESTQNETQPQNLAVAMTFSSASDNSYICNAAGLYGNALYYIGALSGILAEVPGFEWIAAVGGLVTALKDAGTPASQALGLTCAIVADIH